MQTAGRICGVLARAQRATAPLIVLVVRLGAAPPKPSTGRVRGLKKMRQRRKPGRAETASSAGLVHDVEAQALLGWWQTSSFQVEFQDTGERADTYGANPLGHMVIERVRMMSILTSPRSSQQ